MVDGSEDPDLLAVELLHGLRGARERSGLDATGAAAGTVVKLHLIALSDALIERVQKKRFTMMNEEYHRGQAGGHDLHVPGVIRGAVERGADAADPYTRRPRLQVLAEDESVPTPRQAVMQPSRGSGRTAGKNTRRR